MKTLYGSDKDDIGVATGEWFFTKQGYRPVAPFTSVVWLNNKDEAVAAAIFCVYTGSTVEVHLNAHRVFHRQLYREIADYAFKTLKVEAIIAKVHKTNKAMKQILPRLGFKYIAVVPYYYGADRKTGDAVMYYAVNNHKWTSE